MPLVKPFVGAKQILLCNILVKVRMFNGTGKHTARLKYI